jgi:hypothetical protein
MKVDLKFAKKDLDKDNIDGNNGFEGFDRSE